MDYTKSPLGFRLRKVLRYARMYGPARTLAKIRAQYHMRSSFESLPPCSDQPSSPSKHIGLIGCGNFAYSTIAYYLRKNAGSCIRGVMDVDASRAASMFKEYGADYHTCHAEQVLGDPAIDLIYVASNHASHAEYGIAAIEAGKAVHIEKPHVVTQDQLERLVAAASKSRAPVRIGFNRPLSPIGLEILKALDEQDGATVINWFVGGHQIDPDHWYFHENEGGRILGNLCHWTDFTLRMIPPEGRYPVRVIPARAASSDCDVAVSFVFGDGSIAALTFSARGHTFEGVREVLSAHKGNMLLSMTDFGSLTIENVEKKRRHRPLFREHGHEAAIMASYAMSQRGGGKPGLDVRYLRQSAELFLATREALESNQEQVLTG